MYPMLLHCCKNRQKDVDVVTGSGVVLHKAISYFADICIRKWCFEQVFKGSKTVRTDCADPFSKA